MSVAAKRSADWMWESMQEASEELRKKPDWAIEMLRNAPRMYPSIRPKAEHPGVPANAPGSPKAQEG